MWFRDLMGFDEAGGASVRQNIELSGRRLTSRVNGRSFQHGSLTIPSLAQLRAQLRDSRLPAQASSITEVVADAQSLHQDPANAGALFQVASQFNLLEMLSPDVSPEHGVDGYELDPTQGPACAVACGAGTIYRNYFAPLDGSTGQTQTRQIDCLAPLAAALRDEVGQPWQMRNGYAFASQTTLDAIQRLLCNLSAAQRDELRGKLTVGLQQDTEVTLGATPGKPGHCVSQL